MPEEEEARARRGAPAHRAQRQPVPQRRRAGAVGARLELPQDGQHPDHRRPRAEDRGRAAQDQELRQEVAERDQDDPGRDGVVARHEAWTPRSWNASARSSNAPTRLDRTSGGAQCRSPDTPHRSTTLHLNWYCCPTSADCAGKAGARPQLTVTVSTAGRPHPIASAQPTLDRSMLDPSRRATARVPRAVRDLSQRDASAAAHAGSTGLAVSEAVGAPGGPPTRFTPNADTRDVESGGDRTDRRRRARGRRTPQGPRRASGPRRRRLARETGLDARDGFLGLRARAEARSGGSSPRRWGRIPSRACRRREPRSRSLSKKSQEDRPRRHLDPDVGRVAPAIDGEAGRSPARRG